VHLPGLSRQAFLWVALGPAHHWLGALTIFQVHGDQKQETSPTVIITTRDGKSIDTERDLTAPERHILQKLFLWKSMAESLDQFREKKDQALLKGWNHSGPIKESPNLEMIIRDLEEKVISRLREEQA